MSNSNYSPTIDPTLVTHHEAVRESLANVHLSSRKLLVFVFFLMIFTVAARPITDPDFWWHLKTGQYVLQTRSIPHTDIFSSFHFGKEWVTHEWLSEVFIFAGYQIFGYAGLIVIFALIISLSFFICYRTFRGRVGHPYVIGFALLLGAFSTLPTWGVRPQMFSLLFASVFLAIIDNHVRTGGTEKLWWLVPLMICWVNLHAGFAIGLGLIALTIIGVMLDGFVAPEDAVASIWSRTRSLTFVLLASVAAVILNPNGLRIYSYPLETLRSHAMMKYITEWWSPDFHEPMFQPLAILMLSTFAVMALSQKRASLRELLLMAVTCAAALRSARNIPFFALVAIPLLAEHSWLWITGQRWSQFLMRPEKRETGRGALTKVALNVLVLILIPSTLAFVRVSQAAGKQNLTSSENFPVAAADFLTRRQLAQPIYNEYGWGGYLIWRLYPDYRIYIDGRADVYGDAFVEEFLRVHDGGPNWREPLDRQGIRTVIVKREAPVARLLAEDSGWSNVFQDPQAVIFTKK